MVPGAELEQKSPADPPISDTGCTLTGFTESYAAGGSARRDLLSVFSSPLLYFSPWTLNAQERRTGLPCRDGFAAREGDVSRISPRPQHRPQHRPRTAPNEVNLSQYMHRTIGRPASTGICYLLRSLQLYPLKNDSISTLQKYSTVVSKEAYVAFVNPVATNPLGPAEGC